MSLVSSVLDSAIRAAADSLIPSEGDAYEELQLYFDGSYVAAEIYDGAAYVVAEII